MSCLIVRKPLVTILKVILSIGVLIGWLFGALICFPIWLCRALVRLIATGCRANLDTMIGGLSLQFVSDLRSGKAPRSGIISLVVLEGSPSFTYLLEQFREHWIEAKEEAGALRYPQFQQFPTPFLGFSFWKWDRDFKVENHVHCTTLPTGNGADNESELNIVLEKLFNASFAGSRSPWQVYLLQNYRNPVLSEKGMAVLVAKTHHVLADGFSLLHMLASMGGMSFDKIQLPSLSLTKGKSCVGKMGFAASVPFRALYQSTTFLWEGLLDRSRWRISDGEKKWANHLSQTRPIPLHSIKRIKNGLECSFTSVLLSAISAGIHKHMESKLELGSKTNDGDSMRVATILPNSSMSRATHLTNQFTGAVLKLPIGAFDSPQKRVEACEQALRRRGDASLQPLIYSSLAKFGDCLFTGLGTELMKNRVYTAGLSILKALPLDVVGGIADCKIIDGWGSVGPFEGAAAACFTCAGYQNFLRISANVEASVMSKAELVEMMESVETQIAELLVVAEM